MNSLKRRSTNPALYGSSLIVLSSIFYGSYGIWTRLMGNSFGPYAQAWIKSALVVVLLAPFMFLGKRKWEPVRWRADRKWFLLLLFASWLASGPLYYAINHAGIGLAVLGMYSGALLMMFFCGWRFNGERYTADKFVATLLALLGLLCTSLPSFGTPKLIPLLLAFVSGLADGLCIGVCQRIKYNSSQITVIAWLLSVVVNLPMAFLLHEHAPELRFDTAWFYLFLFTLASIASSWPVVHGAKMIEAGVAGTLGLLEIVWALLFGAIFFHESPGVAAGVGAVCIVMAATVPYIKELRSHKPVVVEEQQA
ncbi:MAG TPA: DMT family transporter [Candidatus Saccharimonadales bacterium]|jgi:drug/metabolite transporter (DMT)-like permease